MAVADALVSKVLDLLTSVITSEVEQKLKLVVGVKKEIKMLTNNLQSIRAVLIDAEKRQLKEETVKLWLHRLKDISYDIDDVLDEWTTEILRSKIEGDEYEYAAKPKRSKVWSFVQSFCFCFQEVGFRHDIAVKITELNESLDAIAKEKDRYSFLLTEGNERVERVMTTSVLNIPEVKHREHDENTVINLLLDESKQNPHVISLVGMGGIGKTTLAKLVYNEAKVVSHFDIKIWICVSDPFDEIRIGKAVLESLKGTAPNLVEMQNIVGQIQQCLSGKKFLLVLDDVWNENSRKWENVEQFLKCGSLGSKLLVTTRKENVARIMNCRDIVRLGLLSNEECWSIFSQIVFSESSIEHNRDLEEIGRLIVDRCKGLPLAIKTIAGLLRFKQSIGEWESVLDSELWELEEVERDVLAPLWLSYYDLPSPLKQCFLYCVIFPKDHKMSKHELIGMWMSQGYLRETQSKDMEMVGEEYFQNLSMRSFFQDFEEGENHTSSMYCKMHDIVHDFGESLIKNKEYCSIEMDESREEELDLSHDEIRHMGVMVGEEVEIPSSFYTLTKLRSLIVLPGNDKISVVIPHILDELTCLRTFSLKECGIKEIPSNISKLIHLRQLDLSDNRELEELPEIVSKLYNLQTLNVEWCVKLKRIFRGIEKLVNLRCLDNSGCWDCFLPKGIEKLSGIRRLSWINIGQGEGDEEEAYLSPRDVKKLNNKLGGELCIGWVRQHKEEVDVKEAMEAQLKEKRNINDLWIMFNSEEEGGEWRKEGDEELLEALEPSPANLKFLEIRHYKGSNKMKCSPSWIRSLSFLRKLVLRDWKNCKQLPHSLGRLSSLKSLEIRSFRSLRKVGVEFYGVMEHNETSAIILFPKLIELGFYGMKRWKEWEEFDEEEEEEEEEEEGNDKKKKRRCNNNNQITIMPSLRSLSLIRCPRLKALPHYILHNTSLQLEIERCNILQQQNTSSTSK